MKNSERSNLVDTGHMTLAGSSHQPDPLVAKITDSKGWFFLLANKLDRSTVSQCIYEHSQA